VARAEAYLRAKFHLDPSNRLATVHQRNRQTGVTGYMRVWFRKQALSRVKKLLYNSQQ